MNSIRALVIMVTLVSLLSCAKGDDEDNSPYKGMSAKQLFDESQTVIAKKQYASAIKRLEALESMYPFSDYAQRAQMDLILAYYKNADYPSAAATAERFIHLYPRAPHVDYAYYMKGMADFQQLRGALATVLPMDESWRDPGTQAQAYMDFSALVQQFPNSRYKANAIQRMIYLRNMFAERELHAANYYFERKMYIAAAERANYAIKTYPQAASTKAALIILYRADKAMGLEKAAAEAMAVYEATYRTRPQAFSESQR